MVETISGGNKPCDTYAGRLFQHDGQDGWVFNFAKKSAMTRR